MERGFKLNEFNPWASNKTKNGRQCTMTWQDNQTTTAFLSTRVKSLEGDDYKNMARVMLYLRGTQELMLTIEPGEHPRWCVDCSYAVHPVMKGHCGTFITLGKGATYIVSTKQKSNTKSTTEAEIVAIDDSIAQILWTRHFLSSQGIYIHTTTIY